MYINENNEECVVINACDDGTLRCIYDDELSDVLHDLGNVKIQRASYVEPNDNGLWIADLSPVNGPKLGPFKLRSEALQAEMRWLMENVFDVSYSGE